jgi:hypothetical protein
MTLAQYQRIAAFWDTKNDEITQIALVVCDIYNLSYDQVNNMNPKKFIKLSKKIERLFLKVNKRPLLFKLDLQTDATKINLGQFIEVQHFLKMGEVDSIHLVGASIWESEKGHKEKAEILLNKNIRYVLQDFSTFLISYADLLNSYKGLFETEEQDIEDEEPAKVEKPHPFIDQYGWIYSATKIAEHLGINLDEAFKLPVIQAFNTLSYLKSYQSYQKHINK